MDSLFLHILNMSIAASWMILAVLILRVFLKKAPRWVNVLLWGLVAVRLVCPYVLESPVSLMPDSVGSGDLVRQWTDDYIGDIDIYHSGSAYYDAAIGAGREPIYAGEDGYYVVTKQDQLGEPDTVENTVVPVLSIVWVTGVAVMLFYAAFSYLRLRKQVAASVRIQNGIWICDDIQTPFILGIVKPRIYIPSGTDEAQLSYIIAHENAHLKCHDHWWKPLGFLVLALHWFNPLVWVAYIMLCRDIELACDEKVIRDLSHSDAIAYSKALLSSSVSRRVVMVCPLAFGEVGVKERVKRVLNYKRPAFWVIIAAIISCLAVAACFLTNPTISVDDRLAVFLDCEIASHHQNENSKDYFCCLDWEVVGEEKDGNTTTLYMWVLYREYSDAETIDSAAHTFTAITVENKDGAYDLVEYWIPSDGAYYDDSVREKVPMKLWYRAMDSQRYIKQQSDKLDKMAKEHFKNAGDESLIPQGDLETAISEAILAHNLADKEDGCFYVESHVLLADEGNSSTPSFGADDQADEITVYLLVLHEKYSTYGNELESVGGTYIPTAITFSVNESGEYIMKEYWEPGVGSDYAKDIRAKFPGAAAEDALLNDQEYVGDLEAQNRNKALMYLNQMGSLDVRIADLLDLIQSFPETSSDPNDYMDAHAKEYKELMNYGQYTLRYCFTEFLSGNQTDLRGQIMASLCKDIMHSWGEVYPANDKDALTGQDWFDAFYMDVKEQDKRTSREELEAHYPAAFLVLSMDSAN